MKRERKGGGREGRREGWMQCGEEKEGRREGGQESWSVGWWIDKGGGVKKAGRNEDERK